MAAKHLIRYFVVSLLIKKPKDQLKRLAHFVKEISYKYNDEFTEYVKILTNSFNFEALPAIFEAFSKVKSIFLDLSEC
jgi:RNA recognition motif-containing protein